MVGSRYHENGKENKSLEYYKYSLSVLKQINNQNKKIEERISDIKNIINELRFL